MSKELTKETSFEMKNLENEVKSNFEEIVEEIDGGEKGRKKPPIRKEFPIPIMPTLNRCIIHTFFVCGYPLSVGFLFDRRSTMLQFVVDEQDIPIVDNLVSVRTFRTFTFESCIFAKIFLILKDIKEDNRDYCDVFVGLKPAMSRYLITFINEKYNFHHAEDPSKRDRDLNSLRLIGWKLQELDNEFLFVLAERRKFIEPTRNFVSRTYGIQISTPRGLEMLKNYYNHFKNIKNPYGENAG